MVCPNTTQSMPPAPDGEVLSTMRADGSRRWLRPKPAGGAYWKKRAVVAWVLMALFTITPWLRWNGQPLFLFDITARRFTFFGTTFHADETLPLALLVLTIFLSVFLLTALLGRVWCGWACPQTVYMEFLYRPIERLVEGKHYQNPKRHPLPFWRVALKYGIFLVLSLHLANTFLSWFVGTDAMVEWTRQSPFEHPGPFMVVAVTTGLMMFDFAFWREQMCTLACPYARFQSVLLDRSSLIVGYDEKRGEPRGNARKLAEQGVEAGDCVDCHRCVTTCPTGIDIRDGLQLECIACTQCIDACDEVMEKVGKPKGLIRYGSQEQLEGQSTHFLRPRVLIYPLLLTGVFSLLVWTVASRGEAQLDFLRARGQVPYRTLDDGSISNVVHINITNRTNEPQEYDVRLKGDGKLGKPQFPLTVPPQTALDATLRVILPPNGFREGRQEIEMELFMGDTVFDSAQRTILGPLVLTGS